MRAFAFLSRLLGTIDAPIASIVPPSSREFTSRRPLLLHDARAQLGENPRWHRRFGCVFWIDARAGRLHRCTVPVSPVDIPATQSWAFREGLDAIAIAPDGRVLLAQGNCLTFLDTETGKRAPFTTLLAFDAAISKVNDCAWAPDGSLWLATMDRAGTRALGGLLRVDATGGVTELARGLTIANGPAVDAVRGVAYLADSPRREVWRIQIDDPARRSVAIRFEENDGYPDGMAVDPSGALWIAHYDGGCLSRWDAEGRRTATVPMGVACPTAVAIVPGGGNAESPHDFRLVVTSARAGAGPDAGGGGLFLLQPPAAP